MPMFAVRVTRRNKRGTRRDNPREQFIETSRHTEVVAVTVGTRGKKPDTRSRCVEARRAPTRSNRAAAVSTQ